MLRGTIFAAVLLSLACIPAQAQKNSELGLFLGGSYYLGDLNPGGHFRMMRPAAGVLFRRNFNPHFAFRLNILYGSLAGDDARSGEAIQQQRNLSFRSPALDITGQLEFNFFPYELGSSIYPFTPYVFVGIGALKFNPRAKLDGNWYELQPLGTEGQGTIAYPDSDRYRLIQIVFPFGLGVKWNVTPGIGMALEWGMRKTFTDYLDDVSTTYADPMALSAENGAVAATLSDRSAGDTGNMGRQRGNSQTKDWYNFTGIMLNFKIGGAQPDCPAYR